MSTNASQEIVHSLVEFKSETVAALSALETKIDGINRRLDVSNGRVSQHEQVLQDLRVSDSQVQLRLHHIEEERQGRLAGQRVLRMAMVERLLWVAGATLLALIVHYLGL